MNDYRAIRSIDFDFVHTHEALNEMLTHKSTIRNYPVLPPVVHFFKKDGEHLTHVFNRFKFFNDVVYVRFNEAEVIKSLLSQLKEEEMLDSFNHRKF